MVNKATGPFTTFLMCRRVLGAGETERARAAGYDVKWCGEKIAWKPLQSEARIVRETRPFLFLGVAARLPPSHSPSPRGARFPRNIRYEEFEMPSKLGYPNTHLQVPQHPISGCSSTHLQLPIFPPKVAPTSTFWYLFSQLELPQDSPSDVLASTFRYQKSEDEKGFVGGVEGELGTPESLPEPERPPLRHIDKYVRPECPCLTKRYTVAVLTCVGFIISFGMRCNMGMAKLQKEHGVSMLGEGGGGGKSYDAVGWITNILLILTF
ncbi:unnamed protein product [Timema podura]|uniref:Uncharacterized protein n=1 Tax=Timema podura TaxID=61482 RepID=A0ABN7NBX9_TIMPD|nr:unnamed protein product [Timema podura]